MQEDRSFTIRDADWTRDRSALRQVREKVFVEEQGVPLELEWDEFDAVSRHVLAEADGEPVGTGRLLPDGYVGRMAVLAGWRGLGVGTQLLQRLLRLAEESGLREVVLHAQTHATPFYRAHGFVPDGVPFLEAGIEHQRMRRGLGAGSGHGPDAHRHG